MKRLFLITNLILSAIINTDAQKIVDKTTLDAIDLPIVNIETVDGEEPTFDKIYPPDGAIGLGIANATKVPGKVTITRLGNTLYDSGEYEKGVSGMTVKVRGNTSAWSDKHPYKIKLQKKADLLCRDDKKYRDKNWVLLNTGYSINTEIALKMCSLTDIQWVPECQYVNLMFNGEYQGLYILIESVEMNEDCRINVSETEGYIVEMDPYWWTEDTYFDTNKTNKQKKYTFKYPDTDDITQEQIDYIKSYIEEAENAIDNGTYQNYIDVPSFATWILLHDMLGTWDSGGSNIFVTKKDNLSKLEMGNLWDFDTIGKMDDDWARVHYDFFYYDQLFNSMNKEFVTEYQKQWNDIKENAFEVVINYMDEYINSDEGKALERSLELENNKYNKERTSFYEQISTLKDYFKNRKDWLENAINGLSTDIKNIDVKDNANGTVYDIAGRKANKNSKGLLIYGNKKIMVR